jgi:antitoxin component YwqK of YwqJK toxin-antitoxin module
MNTVKNALLLLLLMMASSSVMAQEINKLDDKGLKHGSWKGVYEESKRPRYQGTFEHGKETGMFTYYDDTKEGAVIATREFNPKDNSAYTIIYNQKKNKVSEGKTVNKLHEGEWKYYHQNSKVLMTIENYKNGKLEGVLQAFYPDGKIAEETTYKNGVKNGPYKKYTTKGIVLEESTYKNGELDGKAVFRWSDGQVVSEGTFVNGLKKGIWKFYEGGKLVRQEKHPLVKKFQKGQPK